MAEQPIDPREQSRQRRGMALVIALIAMVGVGKAVLADSMDPDAFWHVRVAAQMLQDGIGPLVDTLSFASDKTPWTPYSWLAELFMRWVWEAGSYRATILVTALCSAGIVGGTAAASWYRARSALPVILATAVGAYLTLPFLSFRPVTFALAILAGIVVIAQRDRALRQRSRWIWAVPVLTAVLTNLHIYAVFAVAIMTIIAIGTFFDDRPRFRRAAAIALLTLLAACCTPMLAGMIETSVRYNAVDPMVAARFIREMTPFYEGLAGKVTLGLVLLIVLLAIKGHKRMGVVDGLLLLFGLVVLLRLGRFAPVFALIAMPIFAAALPAMKSRALSKTAIQCAVGAVLLMGLTNIAVNFPRRAVSFDQWANRFVPDVPGYPTAASDWVLTHLHPPQKRLINEFDWGGYLAWRFGPEWQVLLDGRTQLYTPAFWRQIYFQTEEDRQALLKSQDATIAILPARNSAFLDSLHALGWEIVYHDEVAQVLVRE